MKTTITKTMLVLGLFIAIASTNSFAQSSLVQLQAMETALNSDIATLQADITVMQANISALDVQIADANSSGDDVSDFEVQRQEFIDEIVLKQNTIADKQAELAVLQAEIANATILNNQQDKNWIVTHNPPVVTPANQTGHVTEVTHPALPNTPLMIFTSTGNANIDEQLVYNWLKQHGLVDY
jgi:septal ring factor EnvC (AmiA/AmiB activator)